MTRMHWRLGCWQFCWATLPMSKWCWRLGGGGEVELKKLQKSELFNTELKKVQPLVGGALRGLGLLHVVLEEHEAAELLKKWLDSVVSVPPGQHWNSPCIHLGNNCAKKFGHVQTARSARNNFSLILPVLSSWHSSCWFCWWIWPWEAVLGSCGRILRGIQFQFET